MPPQESTSTAGNDHLDMLKKAFKCVNGTLDFEKFAQEMGVANGEAMRKRFKRFFEKDGDPLNITSSTLGAGGDGATTTKTPKAPRTPKTKSADSAVKDADTPTTSKAKSSAKKRKASDSEEATSGDDIQPIKAEDVDDDAAVERPSTPPPTKKAKVTKATPKTPKSPKPSKSAKSPKTPKAGKAAKSSNMPVTEGTTSSTDSDGEKKLKAGSPEVQAIVDGEVKKAEKATGGPLDEPVKQAIHDGVEKDAGGSDAE